MRKKAIAMSIMIIVTCFFAAAAVYNNLYKIDTSSLRYNFLARIVDSPDSQYSLSINIRRTAENSDVTFIQGHLYSSKDDHKNSRVIFWQKVHTAEIQTHQVDESTVLDNWVDVEWVDSQTVMINHIEVNLGKGYDYRRSFNH